MKFATPTKKMKRNCKSINESFQKQNWPKKLTNVDLIQIQSDQNEFQIKIESSQEKVCFDKMLECTMAQSQFNSIKYRATQRRMTSFPIKGIEAVKINRARLFDWFIEICSVFKQGWKTFFSARQLLDRIIVDSGIIKTQNIHLYATLSFYISSKYHESNPLKMKDLTDNIFYGKYNNSKINQTLGFILQKYIFSMNCPTLQSTSVIEKIYHFRPQISEEWVKRILIELTFVYMMPDDALYNGKQINQTELLEEIIKKVLVEQRYGATQIVEENLFDHYGCLNLRRYGLKIKL